MFKEGEKAGNIKADQGILRKKFKVETHNRRKRGKQYTKKKKVEKIGLKFKH